MNFKKLRVHGFKSFVDPVELLIEPGITGVVGPNGCGKSNVIESLRWVMGEASARRMRGGEMDDVIFGGASSRPARNSAEVSVTLDNHSRLAPAAFNDSDELEITRRIDRGQGSAYRINGKDVRARDVQLLFADLATGANSTAIVSQGRVGALIGAKPTDRRILLEEAAGIKGLHSRRHEAELRLKAAETNLERLDDVIGALEGQFGGLQRQARQANRYRKIAEQLRAQEGILLHLRWQNAQQELDRSKSALAEAEALVAERTETAARGTTLQIAAHEILPKLREAATEAAARLQSQVIAEGQLESEAGRVTDQLEELRSRLDQIGTDISREEVLATDAEEALERLTREKQSMEAQQAAEKGVAETLRQERDDADKSVAAKEEALESLTQHLAAVDAQRGSLSQQIEQALVRQKTVEERISAIAVEAADLTTGISEAGDIETLKSEVEGAEQTLMECGRKAAEIERDRLEAEQAVTEARIALTHCERASLDHLNMVRNAARESLTRVEREGREQNAQCEREGREALEVAHQKLTTLQAEAKALHDILSQDEDDISPILEDIQVFSGFEAALGAALGEDLGASLDQTSARYWTDLGGMAKVADLPPGAAPLSGQVKAPGALRRRLSQIGVVEDSEEAERLQGDLAAGQRLVSREGGLWRWDGLRIRPGTPTAAARQLEYRNRLADLQSQIPEGEHTCSQIKAEADAALDIVRRKTEKAFETEKHTTEQAIMEAEKACENQISGLQGNLEKVSARLSTLNDQTTEALKAQQEAYVSSGHLRDALVTLERQITDVQNRQTSLLDEKRRLTEDRKEVEDRISAAREALKVLENPDVLQENVSRTRTILAELRARQVEKRSACDQLERQAKARGERLMSIEAETRSWKSRSDGAARRQKDLEDRRLSAGRGLTALEARPAEISEQRAFLRSRIAELETERKQAVDKLAEAELAQRDTDQALKAAEVALAEAREARVRCDSAVGQSLQTIAGITERIREKLECCPEEVLDQTGLEKDAALPPADDVERRIERLSRERDNIGPVNLRAEQEAQELEEQITSMQAEKEDLIAAIHRLRQGIGALNREGRERLLKAFEDVDRHFRKLFVELFGGGEAHLKLTESDDPLLAGLEIMASPPGKKMQILSLLSGGEQALTALALLFGVFLTNPAPICVLDEVDAPLDDSNVDRFCQMVDKIAKSGTTRFLVVTHHRMTMARVDRLFGVTMAERGVSQLVSVDLRQAERMREAGY